MLATSIFRSSAFFLLLASPVMAEFDVTDVALGASVSSKDGAVGGNVEMTYFSAWRQPTSRFHTTGVSFELGIAQREKDESAYDASPSTVTLAASIPTNKTVSASNSLIAATTFSTSVSKKMFLGVTVGASFRFVRQLNQDISGNLIAAGDSTKADFLIGGVVHYAVGDYFLIMGGDNRRGARLGLSKRFQF